MVSLVKYGLVAVYFLIHCYSANALPTSPFPCHFASLEDCIRSYWSVGYKYTSIVTFLATYHGIQISLRQLKYLINIKYNLRRRRRQSTANEIRRAVCYELNGPGYRSMTRCLRTRYNLSVSRDTVMRLLKEIDPVGVSQRRARRLQRRIYRCPGPNATWPIDSYDKLTSFGFVISGCIDGYSRRIIFLQVSHSNHDLALIAGYFMDSVEHLGGCPRMVWTDCGTENVIITALQHVFHDNTANNQQTYGHRYVASTSNQRIELWWCIFRKSRSEWWLELFKDLAVSGVFCDGNITHVYCLRYCFMEILQKDLNFVASSWNKHVIRASNMSECPSGIPDELFFLPENSGLFLFVFVHSLKLLFVLPLWPLTRFTKPSKFSSILIS